jgi:hypothetical protein
MVTRLGGRGLGLSNLVGCRRSSTEGRGAGSWHPLQGNDSSANDGDLDFAIGQLASGLRVLLNLGLRTERDNIKERSYDMATDVSKINAGDRYDVLVVEKYEDGAGTEKSNWTRVGVAFPHKDGNGLNVELRAIPVSGKLVIRRHEAKSQSSEN